MCSRVSGGGIPQTVYKIPLKNDASAGITQIDAAEIIDRIIIGPTPYAWAIWEAFVEMLRKIGVTDPESRVCASTIPLRT